MTDEKSGPQITFEKVRQVSVKHLLADNQVVPTMLVETPTTVAEGHFFSHPGAPYLDVLFSIFKFGYEMYEKGVRREQIQQIFWISEAFMGVQQFTDGQPSGEAVETHVLVIIQKDSPPENEGVSLTAYPVIQHGEIKDLDSAPCVKLTPQDDSGYEQYGFSVFDVFYGGLDAAQEEG